MEENVPRKLVNIEDVYDNMPYHAKEYAGMPNRFYQLSDDQQSMFRMFMETGLKPVVAELQEERDTLVAIICELENDLFGSGN